MIKDNKITQKLIAVLTSAVLGISLVGCGESAENTVTQSTGSNTESTTTETRAAEQVLNLVLAPNVSTLDSNAYSWVQEGQLISSIQEPLMRKTLDENGNDTYIGAGAESYEVSDDGLVYTLHLRDNLWTDGQPVTAQDYAYAYVRELTAANGFTNVSNYTYIKNGAAFYEGTITEESELGIQAVDDKTLEITLEVPDLDALSKVADSYPIRKDVVENAKSQYGTNINELLYSGPFVVTEWTPDNKVVLNKNEQYWDAENISLQTVNLVYAAEAGTQATLFESGQLDIVEYNDDYAETWSAQAGQGKIQAVVQPKSMVRYLIFNQNGKSGLMDNAKIRLALSLAIDRKDYLDTVFGGRYYPAWDFVPFPVTVDGEPFNQKDEGTIKTLQEQYDTDDKLQALLKEGLAEKGYTYSDLKDVTINLTDKSTSTIDQSRIEYLRQIWESRLGITVETIVTSDFTYMDGDYDVTNVTWTSANVYAALKNFGPEGKPKLTGFYEDEEITKWFEEVKGTTDYDTYRTIYKEIENKLVSTGVVAPIYWGDTRYFEQNYVKDIRFYNLSATFDFTRAYIVEH